MNIATPLPGCALRPWRAADRDSLMRHSVTKDGCMIDSVLYARTAA